jgi:hypothetical protein
MVEQARSDPMIAKILSPEWAAVLVVDVQNDFCHEQGAMGGLGYDMGAIQSSVRAPAGFLNEARRVGVPVIFRDAPRGMDQLAGVADAGSTERRRNLRCWVVGSRVLSGSAGRRRAGRCETPLQRLCRYAASAQV